MVIKIEKTACLHDNLIQIDKLNQRYSNKINFSLWHGHLCKR
jgi:hypothetical protein